MPNIPRGLDRFVLIFAVGWISVGLALDGASAKDCGGEVQCECGDTVQGRAVLRADLGVCKETGLLVANGSLLDCDHHTITGRGQEAGVLFDKANGAEVHNCSITDFQIGVRVKGGQGNAIVGNEILGSEKYGIDLADAAAGVRIEANTIRASDDEGIHVGTGASDNVILGNQIQKSRAEHIYLLHASRTVVIGNVVSDSREAGAGIFIKHSDNSYVADNIVWDTPIQLRGGSWGNVLEDNALRDFGSGYVMEALNEGGVWSFPHDNHVRAGTVFNAEACVELDGANNNRVESVTIDDVCIPVRPAGALDPALGNVVDLQQTHQEQLAARAAVQVATNTRVVKPGDVLTLGLAVRNGPFNEPLDLYVGVFLPDNQIAFFSGPGLGNLSIPGSARSMQLVAKGASLTVPRFVEIQLPPGAPPGTYQFFAALVKPGALSDGVVSAAELAAFDVEAFSITR